MTGPKLDTRSKEQIALDDAMAALDKLTAAFPHLGHQWKVFQSKLQRLSFNKPSQLPK